MEPRPDGRGKAARTKPSGDVYITPQWSPGLMAGGRSLARHTLRALAEPQWSPGLMAGGRGTGPVPTYLDRSPQWSPGLMAGGRAPDGSPWESRDLSGDFERSQRRWVIAS